jgi:hypothetical protein
MHDRPYFVLSTAGFMHGDLEAVGLEMLHAFAAASIGGRLEAVDFRSGWTSL